MQLFVRHERTRVVNGMSATDDASVLLDAVERATGVPRDHSWVTFGGKKVHHGHTLSSYGLCVYDTVHLRVRGFGGLRLEKAIAERSLNLPS